MNMGELVSAISSRTGQTKPEVREALSALAQVIGEVLTEGGEVSVAGVGKFFVRDLAPRTVICVDSKEPLKLPALKGARFKSGAQLRRAINREGK